MAKEKHVVTDARTCQRWLPLGAMRSKTRTVCISQIQLMLFPRITLQNHWRVSASGIIEGFLQVRASKASAGQRERNASRRSDNLFLHLRPPEHSWWLDWCLVSIQECLDCSRPDLERMITVAIEIALGEDGMERTKRLLWVKTPGTWLLNS